MLDFKGTGLVSDLSLGLQYDSCDAVMERLESYAAYPLDSSDASISKISSVTTFFRELEEDTLR